MGWWDDIKGWGTDLYNGVTALPVRRFVGDRLGDIKTFGTNLYNNTTAFDVAVGVSSYSYKTIRGLFEQVATIPKITHSVMFHANTQMVAGHILRVAFEDLLPLVMVTYTNDMIQRYGQKSDDEEQNQAYLSIDTAITMGLGLLQLGTWAYTIRKKLQMTTRTIVLTIEAGRNLNGVIDAPKMTLCNEQKCSTLRFVQGSIRDTAAFFATEAAISLIGWIPVAGESIAAVLSIHHRGRYIATVVLPDLCNRHQVEYLKEHPELATSLGSGHAILSALAVWGVGQVTNMPTLLAASLDGNHTILKPVLNSIGQYTNVPAIWYEAAVTQFMMFTSISMAAHMSLPKPVANSSRSVPDPVAAYQGLVGIIVDTILLGIKAQIPRMLNLPPSNIDWKIIGNCLVAAWEHPYARRVEFVLVPRMLRSKRAFTQDPVIAPNWAGLRETSIIAIESIEKVKNHLLVKVGSHVPKFSAKTLWYIFGAPKSVVEILLKLMGNDAFMSEVSNLRRKLEAMDNMGLSELGSDRSDFEVRNRHSLLQKALPQSAKKIVRPEEDIDPQKIIEPKPILKQPTVESKVVKRVTRQLTDDEIINPRRGTLFDAADIILPRQQSGQSTMKKPDTESSDVNTLGF